MVKIERGKTIFDSSAQTLVNTINCVGVMGKGLALEFKNRYPAMFDKYKSFCDKGVFKPGVLWIYKAEDGKWILNFPTKIDWKNPSKIEYIEEGLKKFVEIWSEKGITSVAFPLLGCSNGGLNPDEVIPIMEKYLNQCEGLDVTIYDHREPIIEDPVLPNPEELVSENIDPVEVVAESAPLVDDEPEVKTVEEPGVVQVEEDPTVIKGTPHFVEEIKTAPLAPPQTKYSEEQEILNEIVAERRAINHEVDKVLDEFANAENTPELRKEVTKKLYNVINRRGFPMGSVFQI
jgi:O-acetyl-ADP-ribose deacetylase (regulator of RNase III)